MRPRRSPARATENPHCSVHTRTLTECTLPSHGRSAYETSFLTLANLMRKVLLTNKNTSQPSEIFAVFTLLSSLPARLIRPLLINNGRSYHLAVMPASGREFP